VTESSSPTPWHVSVAVDRIGAAARVQVARANRERALERLAALVGDVAHRHGYADIGALVQDMTRARSSPTGISLACGMDKDWMSRRLPRLAPEAAAAASAGGARLDARWLPTPQVLGLMTWPAISRSGTCSST
jgi:hypothetical protein